MAPLMSRQAIGQNGKRYAMQAASGSGKASARGSLRKLSAAAIVLCLGSVLGSCGSATSEDAFSASVADHWPQWAGGMPDGVPPRPGAPGYQQFIAHGQADQNIAPQTTGANATAVPVTPVFQTAPAAAGARPAVARNAAAAAAPPVPPIQAAAEQQAAPAVPQPAPGDTSVVRGGLY